MNKNLLLGIFGNVAPEGKIIKYMSSEAVSGGWVDNNTDTNRNTFVNGEGTLYINDGVTSIGGESWSTDDSPFIYRTDVTSVDLSNSGLINIGTVAFYDCSGLTSVTIPNSVTNIGNSAFSHCSGLTSVTIPDSVTSIGDNAFSSCSSLTSITIPDSVASINSLAFNNCSSLTSIEVADGNSKYDSRNNCNAIIETTTNMLVTGCKNTIIPSSVTSIGNSAFSYCSGLISVTIPNLIINIGNGAFVGCSSLTEVTCLATTPPTLGTGNFTASNDTLYVPEESVTTYKSVSSWNTAFTNIEAIPPMILYKSSQAVSGSWVTNNTDTNRNTHDSITHEGVLYLNPDVTTIGGNWGIDYSPFCNNSDVTEIDLSLSNLTYIGNYAFYICSGLTSVAIPDSVTSIGQWAFSGCTSLTSIIIPDSVTTIGYGAFNGCSRLTSITIPDNVTSIEQGAFWRCSGLTSIVVGSNNIIYDSRNNCNAIIKTSTNTLIVGCQNTVIPNDVTSIGESAFDGCSSLTSIEIPNNITSIGNGAFGTCSGLTSVTIPNDVTSISNSIFAGCYNLTSVTIPNDVTSIGERAFLGCSSLESIAIPNRVTSIGSEAFWDCSRLTSVTCLATNPPTLGTNNFTAENDTLYVPSESVSAYESDDSWRAAFTTITVIR